MNRLFAHPNHWLLAAIASLVVTTSPALAAAQATPARKPITPAKTLWVVTFDHRLVKVNASRPHQVLRSRSLRGLDKGDRIAGLDYRVAKGVLFALSEKGRLYTLDTETARLTPVADPQSARLPTQSRKFGLDFNPTVDRIRVVAMSGENFRLHPETGAQIDGDTTAEGIQTDAPLRYVDGDRNIGKKPQVVAAAYTYNKTDEKLTTNYALDRATGTLVIQGSKEGVTPAVSPNTGQLTTVGPLGLGAFTDAAFDIADIDNSAYAAIRVAAKDQTRLFTIDLSTGKAKLVGVLGTGARVLGMAIEP
jgi:hypothetical protein